MIITYTGSFKCIAPIFLDYEQKHITSWQSPPIPKFDSLPYPSVGGKKMFTKMTVTDDPTIIWSHLVVETAFLRGRKKILKGVVTKLSPLVDESLIKFQNNR